jgi:hypothetical protein
MNPSPPGSCLKGRGISDLHAGSQMRDIALIVRLWIALMLLVKRIARLWPYFLISISLIGLAYNAWTALIAR